MSDKDIVFRNKISETSPDFVVGSSNCKFIDLRYIKIFRFVELMR